ncbi:MAG: peptidoglycan-binding protein [Nitrosomonas sp.]|nr:peptidoglycan-binding protein [Nitrosomonas sp.]
MRFCKISALTAYMMLVLAAGLLLGCNPPADPKADAKKSKEIVTEPAKGAAAVAESVTKIDEVGSIESLGAAIEELDSANMANDASAQGTKPTAKETSTQTQVVDDGNDVVKVTPVIMRKVQQALVNAGFNPGPVDGVSGAKTQNAIESFQKQNNLPAGKLTKNTLRALGVDF